MRGRGRARELAVRDHLRAQGWVVRRLADGPADLVALKAGVRPLLVQVKSTAGGPWEHFGPADRTALEHEAISAGADATLAYWPPQGRLRWFPAARWPQRKQAA
jgi:hypothetical protein